jgi:hypothetical protein
MTVDLKPPVTLLMGAAGAGKTTSLRTFVEAGLELFVLVTEPTGVDSLLDSFRTAGLPLDKLHWHVVAPTAPGLKALKDAAKLIKAKGYEELASLKTGIGKEHQTQAMAFLEAIEDFTDARTGESFGDVTEWDDTRAFVVDSMSGLNRIVLDNTVGLKPSMHQGEWGVAMNFAEQLVMMITSSTKCHVAFTAHIEREPNEITGVPLITFASIGRKLAPRLTKMFSEVVLAERGDGSSSTQNGFRWSTAEQGTELKNRALPVGSNLTPSFVPIVEAYRKRKAELEAEVATASETEK